MLGGGADHTYAYSFIVTNLAGDTAEIEEWFRGRALVLSDTLVEHAGPVWRH